MRSMNSLMVKTSTTMTPTRISQRPLFGVHYRKLVEETSPNKANEMITFIHPLTVSEYLWYSCKRCGHQQEIKSKIMTNKAVQNVNVTSGDVWPSKINNLTNGTCVLKNGCASSNSTSISTPTSDEGNSPTELNIYKRLLGKPPLVKRLPANLRRVTQQSTSSEDNDNENDCNDDGLPSTRPPPEGCTATSISRQRVAIVLSEDSAYFDKMPDMYELRNMPSSSSSPSTIRPHFVNTGVGEFGAGKHFQNISWGHTRRNTSVFNRTGIGTGSCGNECHFESKILTAADRSTSSTFNRRHGHKVHRYDTSGDSFSQPSHPAPPPLPPERADSLCKQHLEYREENELKCAPWFQAGIPREITLEVLSREPVGSFMVRESITKLGCYALSLRVPNEYHPRGIAHYLIIRTNKGYKIKGFTKEFSTLTALITHHSVMQELLPCPLLLSKCKRSPTKSNSCKDLEDFDAKPN